MLFHKYLSLLLVLSFLPLSAQHKRAVHDPQNELIAGMTNRVTKTGSLHLKDGITMQPEIFMEQIKSGLGLTQHDSFVLFHEELDESGNPVYRFQQYFQGIPVIGGDYVLQTRDGQLSKLKGRGAEFLNLDTQVRISEDIALEKALQEVDADVYTFDNPDYVAEKQDLGHNVYPEAETVIVRDPRSLEDKPVYCLALRYEIESIEPFGHWQVYIDAETGKVIKKTTLSHSASNTTGTVDSAYNGTRTFWFRKRGWPYKDNILKTTTHGTMTVKQSSDLARVAWSVAGHIKQGSYHWTRIEASLMWTAQQAYEYFKEAHNRSGVDGADEDLRICAGSETTSYSESGGDSYIRAVNSQGAALDVMAHEYTHGVIRHTSVLAYESESGALNESFADIFGTLSERRVVGDANYDWLIGGDFGAFRNMERPNQFWDPDTYGGLFWFDVNGCIPDRESNDHCGVHRNSGVQNRWFQLLVDGGTQNGVTVTGIGAQRAGAIAYRNMTLELTSRATYQDAREGAIDAAEILYGICSNDVQQVRNAWAAVGVGEPAGVCHPPLRVYVSGPTIIQLDPQERNVHRYTANARGGVPPYTYRWETSGFTVFPEPVDTTADILFYEPGNNYVSVTVTDSVNQRVTRNVSVYVRGENDCLIPDCPVDNIDDDL